MLRVFEGWRERLAVLMALVAVFSVAQATTGVTPASAAGINCRDLGNGLLCSNSRWPNGTGEWGFTDIWYDKYAGPAVEIVAIGYWHEGSPGYTDAYVYRTLYPGQRVMHNFERPPYYGPFCITPRLWYRPAGTQNAPQRLDGAQNCF
ncbi:hypothetical protein [Streptomyces sp. NPDC001292]|uniref:hypothetical protein n=1 Tax=Streptomyces sp. NPDC001292 TaxID=3364558 RepID=UPI0036A1DE36